jgi:hypothetical protein
MRNKISHTGDLVENTELFFPKVAYSKYHVSPRCLKINKGKGLQ